jgi:hypothetical protein
MEENWIDVTHMNVDSQFVVHFNKRKYMHKDIYDELIDEAIEKAEMWADF